MRHWALPAGTLILLAACSPPETRGPQKLLDERTVSGSLPPVTTLRVGNVQRRGLAQGTVSRVFLPRRALLSFGLAAVGRRDRSASLRAIVRSDGRFVGERELDARSRYRHATVAFDGPGRPGTLEVELRLLNDAGRAVPVPDELQVAVTDPTLFDREAIRGVVLVSLDTLRRDHVGLHGYPRATTPRLDGLGREGLVFEDAVSVSSWTLPAHLSMLTWVEPAAHGGVDGHHGFNRTVPTLAQTLRRAGFYTHAVTSQLYVSPQYGLEVGFDVFDYVEGRRATEVAERALLALDVAGPRPFFLFLHFYDPHWPYVPPPAFAGAFGPGQTRGAATRTRPPATVRPRDPRALIADYDAEIRYTDTELGRVLDHLRHKGLERQVLVIVTSDHGEEFGEHGGYEHLRTLYEEVIRVPLVIRGPGLAPGREARSVSLLDIAPTVLDAVGLAPERTHVGRSLLGPLGPRESYGETELGARQDGVRTRKLFLRTSAEGAKLILSLDRRSGRTLREEWYDLGEDPDETTMGRPSERARAELRDLLVRRWRQAQSRGAAAPGVVLTAGETERLQALGYTE